MESWRGAVLKAIPVWTITKEEEEEEKKSKFFSLEEDCPEIEAATSV